MSRTNVSAVSPEKTLPPTSGHVPAMSAFTSASVLWCVPDHLIVLPSAGTFLCKSLHLTVSSRGITFLLVIRRNALWRISRVISFKALWTCSF